MNRACWLAVWIVWGCAAAAPAMPGTGIGLRTELDRTGFVVVDPTVVAPSFNFSALRENVRALPPVTRHTTELRLREQLANTDSNDAPIRRRLYELTAPLLAGILREFSDENVYAPDSQLLRRTHDTLAPANTTHVDSGYLTAGLAVDGTGSWLYSVEGSGVVRERRAPQGSLVLMNGIDRAAKRGVVPGAHSAPRGIVTQRSTWFAVFSGRQRPDLTARDAAIVLEEALIRTIEEWLHSRSGSSKK